MDKKIVQEKFLKIGEMLGVPQEMLQKLKEFFTGEGADDNLSITIEKKDYLPDQRPTIEEKLPMTEMNRAMSMKNDMSSLVGRGIF